MNSVLVKLMQEATAEMHLCDVTRVGTVVVGLGVNHAHLEIKRRAPHAQTEQNDLKGRQEEHER